ncbi:hypothetical protein D3C86_1401710 [compost metagenome]
MEPLQREFLEQARRALLATRQKIDRCAHAQGHAMGTTGHPKRMGEPLLLRKGDAGQKHIPIGGHDLPDSRVPGGCAGRQNRGVQEAQARLRVARGQIVESGAIRAEDGDGQMFGGVGSQQVCGNVRARIDRQPLAAQPGQMAEDAAVAELEVGPMIDLAIHSAFHQLDDMIDIGRDDVGVGTTRQPRHPIQQGGAVVVDEVECHEARHGRSLSSGGQHPVTKAA